MKYGGGKYNISPFNAPEAAEAEGTLRLVTARGIPSATKIMLKASVLLRLKPAAGIATARVTLCIHIPLTLLPAWGISMASLTLTIRVQLFLGAAHGISGASTPLLRQFALDSISLPGLVLRPGEVLMIDTDKIIVEKNGVNVIEFWKTGSTPFRFGKGENILTYYDENSGRNADMTVVWRNRWL